MANCSGVAPSLMMTASSSANETGYRYQIFKTSFPCGTTNLGQYYDSGWKVGQAPDINLTSVYTFFVNNTYRVILTVKNNCDQTNELAKCVTIIPNTGACGLALSPNPANTEVVASFELNSDIDYSIDITRADNQAQHSIQARALGKKGNVKKTINLAPYSSGNYYIIVTTPVNVITEKLVIAK